MIRKTGQLFSILILVTLGACHNERPTHDELESDIDELRSDVDELTDLVEELQAELEDIKRDDDVVPIMRPRTPQDSAALELLRRSRQAKGSESERIENQEWYRREKEIARKVREYMDLQRSADIFRSLGDCQELLKVEAKMDSIRLEVPETLLPARVPSRCQ